MAATLLAGFVTPTPEVGASGGPGVGAQQAALAAPDYLATPAQDAPGVTVTFGLGPAQPTGLDARQFFNYVVTPNGVLSDYVAVRNIGNVPLDLRLYATDPIPGSDGSSDLLAADKKPADAATWITFKTPDPSGKLAVPPQSTTVIPMSVTVPPSASPGDHVAGVIASLTTVGKNAKGDSIQFEQRVAVRAFFRVSGPIFPNLTIEDFHASYKGDLNPLHRGTITIRYRIHNKGNVRLGAHQLVDFSGLFGSKVGAKGLADAPTLLPTGSVPVTVTLHGVLPEVIGTAHVKLDPVPPVSASDPGLRSAVTSKRVLTIPWVLLAILVLILGWMWLRRRRKARGGPGGERTLAEPQRTDYNPKRLVG